MAVVTMGSRALEVGSEALGSLADSTPLLDDPVALSSRLADDGYLLLRGVLDRAQVLAAREVVLAHAAGEGWLGTGDRLADGVTGKFLGGEPVTRDPAVLAVLESPGLFALFRSLFGEDVLTFDFKWLRLVGRKEFTGAHIDRVYMGRGSDRLRTAWVPLGDVPLDEGPLAVCVGSHRLPAFDRLHATYGEVDVDRDLIDGIFTDDPLEVTETFGGRWCTAAFAAGDVLVLDVRTMHASLDNAGDRCRISCDVRFQPAADAVDDRWMGEQPIGHHGLHSGRTIVSVSEARRRWGI